MRPRCPGCLAVVGAAGWAIGWPTGSATGSATGSVGSGCAVAVKTATRVLAAEVERVEARQECNAGISACTVT